RNEKADLVFLELDRTRRDARNGEEPLAEREHLRSGAAQARGREEAPGIQLHALRASASSIQKKGLRDAEVSAGQPWQTSVTGAALRARLTSTLHAAASSLGLYLCNWRATAPKGNN